MKKILKTIIISPLTPFLWITHGLNWSEKRYGYEYNTLDTCKGRGEAILNWRNK